MDTATLNLAEINSCVKQLITRKLTIAFAESATAGAISAAFSLGEHAGKCLKGGLVCYDANVKEELLKVDPVLVERYTPESPEVTEAITKGLPLLFDADFYVGCAGLACAGGSETEEKPVGTMFFHGIYQGETIFAEKAIFSGTQAEIVAHAVNHVVNLLLRYLGDTTVIYSPKHLV